MIVYMVLCVWAVPQKYLKCCSASNGWIIAAQICQPWSISNSISCINELLISINLHCWDSEVFALLTCTWLGLKDIRGCRCVVLFPVYLTVSIKDVTHRTNATKPRLCSYVINTKLWFSQSLPHIMTTLAGSDVSLLQRQEKGRKLSPSSDINPFSAWWVSTLKCGERQRQTGTAKTGVCHGCEELLLRRWRDGGRQRHIEADAEKCERVSVRLVMTRSWLRRAGEAAALALTHLIPTGPPGWRHSACTVAFLCFNFFLSSSHTWAFLTSERLWKCAFVRVQYASVSVRPSLLREASRRDSFHFIQTRPVQIFPAYIFQSNHPCCA